MLKSARNPVSSCSRAWKGASCQRSRLFHASAVRTGSYAATIDNLKIGKHTRVIFQGFTGKQATANAVESIEWGTNIVGGVKPGFEGEHLGLPVVPTVKRAMEVLKPDATGIYVAAHQATRAIEDAIEAEVPLIVAVAEHIPLHDILRIHSILATQSKSRLVGANSPGIISAIGHCRIGFQPLASYTPGNVGVAAKSGTLSYEAVTSLTQAGLGQSLCIGVGGDVVSGTDLVDSLRVLEKDPDTEAIVLIGEIGGVTELEAAEWIREYRKREPNPKPIAAIVGGFCVKPGKVMGHAGAWAGIGEPSAQEKAKALEAAGAVLVEHPAKFGKVVQGLLARSRKTGGVPSNKGRRGYHTLRRPTLEHTHSFSHTKASARRLLYLRHDQAVTLLDSHNVKVADTEDPSPSGPILTFTIDRSTRKPCIIITQPRNGKSSRVSFSYSTGPEPQDIQEVLADLGSAIPEATKSLFTSAIQNLWGLYVGKEGVTLSLHVNSRNGPGSALFSNPQLTFDDAAFRSTKRHSELHALRDVSLLDPAEVAAEPHNLVFTPLFLGDGPNYVGTLVNGAGLAMSTIDSLHYTHGLSVSNFLDTGGKATAETTAASLALILQDERVKVVFVNIFGGLTKCEMIAQGVIDAVKKIKAEKTVREVPVVVRLRGTGEDKAKEVVAGCGLDLAMFYDFEEAVAHIRELIAKA